MMGGGGGGVGLDNRAIPGSICVGIHSTCAPHISTCWRTDGRQGSRLLHDEFKREVSSLMSELFSVTTVIYDDTESNKITEQRI